MSIAISQLVTGAVNGDVELPGTNPLDTTSGINGTTYKYFVSDILQYMLSAQGFVVYQSCVAASTASLTAAYANGTLGVGATLTNSGAQSALTLDGVTLKVNDRVLIKNQAALEENGIYVVTTVGSSTVNWVLTRAQDFNQASEIIYLGVVLINQGATQQGVIYQEVSQGPFTIGTSPIMFQVFSLLSSGGGQFPATLPVLTYTVTPYLTNAENLGALANGFVYSTVASGISTISTISSSGAGDVVLSTSPTITSPIIASQILDTNSNPIIGLGVTSNAVNYLTLTNQGTGVPPFLSASGSDTNISINVAPKGTGLLNLVTAATTNPLTIVSGTGSQHITTFNFSDTSASQSVTFPDLTGTVALSGASQTVSFNDLTLSTPLAVTSGGTGLSMTPQLYANISNTSISSTITTVVFTTATYDNYSAYNSSTGRYTVPVDGMYNITSSIIYNSTSIGTGGVQVLYVKINSTTYMLDRQNFQSYSNIIIGHNGSLNIRLSANDTVEIQAYNNTTTSLDNTDNNIFSLAWIGN